jgi:hypothetical protein
MQSETVTVKACEVKVGDVTALGIVESDAYLEAGLQGELATFWTKDGYRIQCKPAKGITISRHVADPCPRGRMDIQSGLLTIDGKIIAIMGTEKINACMREVVVRWNKHEDRTAAEIEAELEVT